MRLVKTAAAINARWYYPLRCLILLALGLLVYGQTFGFDFVFDDHQFIVRNPYIKDIDKLNLIWDSFPRTRMVGMYSFAVNYLFNQLHPSGYHIFNFLVHLLAVVLVWALSAKLFKIAGQGAMVNRQEPDWLYKEAPFIIAVLFLVHPCQTQAVTYITQRFESMATVFYLGAVYAYLCGRTAASIRSQLSLFVVALICAVLGVMTKEVAATIPVMILALEWILWPGEKKINRKHLIVALIISTFMFSLLFMKLVRVGLGVLTQSVISESHDGDVLTAGNYFLTQMRVFITFWRVLIFPINQNLEYDYPMSTGLLNPPLTLVGLGVIASIIYLIVRFRRKMPLAAVGLAWMLITFAMNMVPRVNVIFEHKLYLISFGFLLAAVVFLLAWIRSRVVLAGILLGVVVVLSVLSFNRNQVWRNELVLWEDIYKKSPGKARVCANLGRIYGNLGRHEEAIEMLSRAVAMNPKDDISYQNRGVCFDRMGSKERAIEDFNKAIEIAPTYFAPYVRRAWVYKQQKQYEKAFADLAEAIRLEPDFESPYIERGLMWMELGGKEEALVDLNKALKIAPYDYPALIYRGVLNFDKGQYELALADFTRAQSVQSANALAYKNRGYCLLAMGRKAQALKDFEMALRLNPDDAQVRAAYEKGLRENNDPR